MANLQRILLIQTAFIGDVILATSLIEEVALRYPEAKIQFLLRKGNESLLKDHPKLEKLWVWDKKGGKYRNLFKLVKEINTFEIDLILNIQRFFSSGLFTALIKAKKKIGFKQNPMSWFFDHKVDHKIPHADIKSPYGSLHEVQRNLQLINSYDETKLTTDPKSVRPKLYTTQTQNLSKLNLSDNYIVMAPTSVWFTKQWEIGKWKELIGILEHHHQIVLIGGPSDRDIIDQLVLGPNVINMAGELSLLESAHLMKAAHAVIVNDSGPMHLASSVNAKTIAIFCSTIPEFGYYPLSEQSFVVESVRPECKPCGLHGHKSCPLGHFKCSSDISIKQVIELI